MSIRAYKVKTFEFDSLESFSLSNKAIIEWLETNTSINENLSLSGKGLFELSISDANRMVKELKGKIDTYTIYKLKDDIKEAQKQKKDYILYYCF